MDAVLLYILNGTGTVLSLLYTAACLKSGLRYFDIIRAADRELFPIPPLLRPGFGAINVLPKLTAVLTHLLTKTMRIEEFEAYCALAWGFAAGVPVLALTCFVSAVTASAELLLCGLAVAVLFAAYPLYTAKERAKKRKEELISGLPAAISKTVLLCGAGLTVTEAWRLTAESGEGPVYSEMRLASEQFRNGIPLTEAMQGFALRCGTKEAAQFASIVSRSISKGGAGISSDLRYLNSESWDARKQRARLKGQAAASALMIPLLMMFLGIIAMILVPILQEISV